MYYFYETYPSQHLPLLAGRRGENKEFWSAGSLLEIRAIAQIFKLELSYDSSHFVVEVT